MVGLGRDLPGTASGWSLGRWPGWPGSSVGPGECLGPRQWGTHLSGWLCAGDARGCSGGGFQEVLADFGQTNFGQC